MLSLKHYYDAIYDFLKNKKKSKFLKLINFIAKRWVNTAILCWAQNSYIQLLVECETGESVWSNVKKCPSQEIHKATAFWLRKVLTIFPLHNTFSYKHTYTHILTVISKDNSLITWKFLSSARENRCLKELLILTRNAWDSCFKTCIPNMSMLGNKGDNQIFWV